MEAYDRHGTAMKNRSGFTLLEISIVLVIIGLIVGGILVGRDMIRNAQLRSVISDVEKFKTAVNSFQVKYSCLPGDCKRATQIWGADTGCPAGTRAGTLTCNGDGNSQISYSVPEVFTFWQQLAIAELIPGKYTGLDGPAATGYHSDIGVNVPASKYPNGGYTAYYWDASNTAFFSAPHNAFGFGGQTSNNASTQGLLTASDAYALDKKFDDGLPATGGINGLVKGTVYGNENCTTATDRTALYATTDSTALCALIFPDAF